MEGADKAVLVLGNQDWPFPILVRKDGTWRFDTVAGREEILFRRIGRNELAAIQTILAFVDAQQEYAEKGIGGNGVYAQRIVSRPGTKDGLYWPAQSGEEESRSATSPPRRRYRAGQQRIPYPATTRFSPGRDRGAPAALDYIVRGKMIGGFALVAYPAQYGNSGVMTFLVNHQGTIYEKDLEADAIAPGMTAFNPDGTWRVSEADQASSAASEPERAIPKQRSTLPAMGASSIRRLNRCAMDAGSKFVR